MKQRQIGVRRCGSLLGCLLLCLCLVPTAWAQQTTGTISVTVVDSSGAVVPGALLTLTDVATNDARTATTQAAGNYTFVNLNFGAHKLTVALEGFETQSLDVLVQSARTTDVKATLNVGALTDVVEVSGVAPLVESTTNAINTTVDIKQIEDLPLGGRNISQFAQLSAGYNGTWNGLPSAAQGNTVDGIIGNTNRWRYQTNNSALQTAIVPRLENIAEMVISTDQLDMNQGFGNSTMQITYVTRRGSNQFHGRLYEDFRAEWLNAKNWGSTTKPKYHQNEVGASVGGPIFRDKMFFFGSFSLLDVPGSRVTTRQFLSDAAEQGVFTYANGRQANLFDIYAAYNAAKGTTFPASLSQMNAMTKARFAEVAGYRQSAGGLSLPGVQPSDPNLRQWEWQVPNSQRTYYPTFRVDYNLSSNWRLNVAYNQTKPSAPYANAEHWPGDGRGAGSNSNAMSLAFGLETVLRPNLLNQVRGGYLYTRAAFGQGGSDGFYTNPTIQYGYGGGYDDTYEMPNSRKQPIFSVSDTVTWVKGSHMVGFGFNAYREVNQYWDPPEGFTLMSLGMDTNDPARDALTKAAIQAAAGPGAPLPTDAEWGNAMQLYAMLTGRVNNFWGRHAYIPATGAYASGSTPNQSGVAFSTLDELLSSWGLFVQDSYRMKPNFTVNMGLRWDFVSPDVDRTGKYHSLTPQDLYGPTGVGQLFNPGAASLTGTTDPVYTAREAAYGHWNITPQPAVGIAWTPRSDGTFVERLLGGDKSVLRASYSFRRFTMPQQFVWDMGSSFGIGFYQNFSSSPSTSGVPGTFKPGSIALGGAGWLPQSCATTPSAPACFVYSPQQYDKVIHMKGSTFVGGAAAAINSDIRQPYTQSWSVGVQRELGGGRALEVRYNGNITRNQWLAMDINEVNIFENGFLNEFTQAQSNLKINQAAGVNSFANRGLPGQVNLPIMNAAGISFTNSTFINQLTNGQAGSFANTLATNRDYFCRMVGTGFEPCGTSYGAGAGYPINFWMANPFALGSWTNASYMSDTGYSNYHGLQLEYRQRPWHGASVTANYTLSKTMGVATATDWTGSYTQFTVRDLKSSYMPLGTDRRHVVHVNAIYELPFGQGKKWLTGNGALDKIVGGWTVSTIVTFQSGTPFRISGNNNTFNNKRDGGLILNGITPQDIQDKVGLYFNAAGQPYFLPPDWVAQVKADGTMAAHNVPGTWGEIFYLHGPHQTYTDIGVSKVVPITGQVRFKFQVEMLNAFNNPTFAQSTTALTSTGFGRASQTGTSRRIELRGNIEF